ncbi:MAG: hypothetical protein AVDCRST_MAG87-2618, partial [uncultured Thermomicrobiales bacterium]
WTVIPSPSIQTLSFVIRQNVSVPCSRWSTGSRLRDKP